MSPEFKSAVEKLYSDQEKLLLVRNEKLENGNGIFDRCRNPVWTAAHTPMIWRYDFDETTNERITEDVGTVFIYYASSDTRMHVATSTFDKLVDYCLNSPADGCKSAASVESLKKQIKRNWLSWEKYSFRMYEICSHP